MHRCDLVKTLVTHGWTSKRAGLVHAHSPITGMIFAMIASNRGNLTLTSQVENSAVQSLKKVLQWSHPHPPTPPLFFTRAVHLSRVGVVVDLRCCWFQRQLVRARVSNLRFGHAWTAEGRPSCYLWGVWKESWSSVERADAFTVGRLLDVWGAEHKEINIKTHNIQV